jgi:hypothetical protein
VEESSFEERRSGKERRRPFKRRGPDRRLDNAEPTLDERSGKDRRQTPDRRSGRDRRVDRLSAQERHYRNRRGRSERRKETHPELIFDERMQPERRTPKPRLRVVDDDSPSGPMNGA